MSTKIYDARRLKPGVKLWPFVASVRERGEKHIKKELTAWYLRMMQQSAKPKNREQFIKMLGFTLDFDEKFTPFMFSSWITTEYKAQSSRLVWDPFGMDVSVVFYEHKGRIYFISYANGMMSRTLDFLRNDKSSEDFHYQNQCDKSGDCSDAAWKRRGETWEAMMSPEGHLDNGLVLELLTPTSFFLLDYKVREALPKKWGKP